MRPKASAGRETIRCRLRFRWIAGKSRLNHSLTCLGVDNNYSSSGYIEATGKALKGSFSGSLGKASVKGRCSASELSLTLTG